MIKKLVLLFIGCSLFLPGFSQYDYKKQGKSVVQVWVEIPGQSPNVCTGFVWKQNDWVVTSLHALHPDGVVKVLYGDYWNKNVSVIRVHEKADLALLKINQPAIFPPGIVPISSADTNAIPYEVGLSSIGYNMGSRAAQPKSLVRGGSLKKETLYNTLPPDIVDQLKAFKVPDVNIEIMMFEGSLLPGYSGSPIFHKANGKLVAIGDGGLDAGTKNVSWGIPARYLAELESSPVTSVPFGIESSPLHYSSKVEIKNDAITEKINNSEEELDTEELYDLIAEDYAGVGYGNFEFYYVKTRSFAELYSTSFDTENLDALGTEFNDMGLLLDYSTFEFDVYEDPFNEVIIVVPAGQPLIIDNDNNFRADLTGFPKGDWFFLSYKTETGDGSNWDMASLGVVETLNSEALSQLLGGWSVNEDYSYHYPLDEYSGLGWIMLNAQYPYYNEVDDESYGVSSYLALLVNPQLHFQSNAVMYMPEVAKNYMPKDVILNCVENYEDDPEACDYFESYMKIVIASHLTNFSFIQYE